MGVDPVTPVVFFVGRRLNCIGGIRVSPQKSKTPPFQNKRKEFPILNTFQDHWTHWTNYIIVFGLPGDTDLALPLREIHAGDSESLEEKN